MKLVMMAGVRINLQAGTPLGCRGFFHITTTAPVYLRRWGKRPETLPSHLVTPDADGIFLVAPSGLDIEDQMTEVYSPDDLAVIQTLGPEWFHLPGQLDRGYAPTLEEFLAATPQPS